MFLGLVIAMTVPTKGEEKFGAVGYDCSNPSNIKVYNAEAHCQHEEVGGERQKVKILQIENTEKQCVQGHGKYQNFCDSTNQKK